MKIAIVGAGISGLTAAYYLQARHDITLLEKNNYLGGHTNTVSVKEGVRSIPIDTGFIVYNDRTYPLFCQLIDELPVQSQPTQMTFGVRCERTGLEYQGGSLGSFFAQRGNFFRVRHYRLLREILRFQKLARQVEKELSEKLTVTQFLSQHRFSPAFTEHFFQPLGSAIWSCPADRFENFPARFVIEFYRHHGLLSMRDRPNWKVIAGGSQEYVAALQDNMDVEVEMGTTATNIERGGNGIQVTTREHGTRNYDHVILACHSNQSLALLGEHARAEEKELLGAIAYQKNTAILHTDTSILPACRRAWACWNYYLPETPGTLPIVTYNMNILQGLSTERTYCVSLNAEPWLHQQDILHRFIYHHPVFDARRREVQQRHMELINNHGVSCCGAYWGHGFHEDGVHSAWKVIESLP